MVEYRDRSRQTYFLSISNIEEMNETFNWQKTQPLYKKDHQQRRNKKVFPDYRLKFNNSYQSIKLN